MVEVSALLISTAIPPLPRLRMEVASVVLIRTAERQQQLLPTAVGLEQPINTATRLRLPRRMAVVSDLLTSRAIRAPALRRTAVGIAATD